MFLQRVVLKQESVCEELYLENFIFDKYKAGSKQNTSNSASYVALQVHEYGHGFQQLSQTQGHQQL